MTRLFHQRAFRIAFQCIAIVLAGLAFSWGLAAYFSAPTVSRVDLTNVTPSVKRAIEFSLREVKNSPRSGVAWGRLGMVLSAHEFATESMACYRTAGDLDRSDVRWPYLLATALEQASPRESVHSYREAIRRNGAAILPKLRLAELYLQLRDLDSAGKLLTELLRAAPSDGRVHFRMAQYLLHRGQIQPAYASAISACELAPKQRAIAELLVQIRHLARLKSITLAGDCFDNLAEVSETKWPDPFLAEVQTFRCDPHWIALQGDNKVRAGQVDDGIKDLERAASEAADNWSIQALLARTYLQWNRLDDAETTLNGAIHRFPQAVDLWRVRGAVRLLQRQWPQATQDFRKAISLKPDDAASHADLAFCLEQLERFEEARREFTEALKLEPNLPDTQIQFAELLNKMGEQESAKKLVDSVLQVKPDCTEARELLDQILRQE